MWPLLHYAHELAFDDAAWDHYVTANHAFADAVVKEVKDGDLVWVHDYHLMLAPGTCGFLPCCPAEMEVDVDEWATGGLTRGDWA